MGEAGWKMEKLKGGGKRRFAPINANKGLALKPGEIRERSQAIFFKTSAEFLEPKPTQLQMACSIEARRPMSGT